jgi:AcrR family transcriptional regulator
MGLTNGSLEQYTGSNFTAFKKSFKYQEDQIYLTVFERNQKRIKLKKADVAATNLKKIFDSAFALSAKIGFHEMSLRDLSKATGISMGGIYSCLSKKEDIALMVLDIVELVTQENNDKVREESDELLSLEMAIKYHLYSSTLLQPWFFFLYFETRSLSSEGQTRSKAIEMNIITKLEEIIQRGLDKGIFNVSSPYFVAHTIVISLQDWYLKPWKNKEQNINLEDYSNFLFIMVKKLLKLDEHQ